MTYTQISLQHLTSLSDGDLVHVAGIYTRDLGGAVLTSGDRRLILLGEPFSYIPRQQAKVEIWGRLLQGKVQRLQIHDVRPAGATLPVPEVGEVGKAGDEITLTAHVRCVGDDQIATTPEGRTYLVIGTELDQRHYTLIARLLGLNPPMVEVVQAVPITQIAPVTRDW
ncbi:hypothetical protein ACFOPQ_09670 [Deinococcus antarcticus]|uniref:DUF5666 domain-containing protein n=1 Tax=Deinococcus antarcticus TaxID=1298767 RepID=A0ABV8A5T2_9DEIO